MRPLAVCLIALASACASSPAPAPAPAGPAVEDYAPLAVGASWTYAVRFPGQTGARTVTILEQDAEGYFVDDAGGRMKVAPDGLRDPQRYLIRAPLQPGRTWKAVVSASAVERYELRSVGEPCEAKAGAFSDCLVVRASIRQDAQHTLHSEFTWARGIGLVKITTTLETDGRRIPQTEQSLLRYSLSGGAPDDEEGPPDAWSR